MEPLIRLEGVRKVYGTNVRTVALDTTDLTLDRGELAVVLGPSGSGKSTLLNLIGGLDRPTEGRLLFDGVDLGDFTADELADYRRYMVGFVFQFYNLIPSLTARENVQFVAEMIQAEDRVEEVLRAVGLPDRAHHFPAQLSGGEQQRVAIARALVKDPPLLLCDEPTGALDYETGKSVLGILEALVQDGQRTVVIVTHNTALAAIGTRQIRLKDGRVIADDLQPERRHASELAW